MKNPFRLGIYGLDYILRRAYKIKPFAEDPDCILRLSFWRAPKAIKIAKGLELNKGDLIAELHLWNEKLPAMPPHGPDLKWGYEMARKLRRSLALLARAVENGLPLAGEVKALGGEIALPADKEEQIETLAQYLGLILSPEKPVGRWGRFVHFWKVFHSMLILWAYNPVSFRYRSFWRMRRYRVWMSKEELLRRYGRA